MDLAALPIYLDPVSQAVMVIDNKNVLYANPAAKALLGSDICSKKTDLLFPEEFLKNRAMSFACCIDLCGQDVCLTIRREGDFQTLYIEKTAQPEAMAVSSQMISYLRNCATGLKLSADRFFTLLDEGKAPDDRFVNILYRNYYQLIRLITQVDSAQKLRHGQFAIQTVPTDLYKLCFELTDTVSKLASDNNLSISFCCDEEQVEAVIDSANIEFMLLNLFSNSIKNTPAGGSITLSLSKAQENILISLDDTGKGIPEEKLSKLFSPEAENFDLSVPEPGLGLGLFIAGSIVRLHNGVMLIESRGNEGTHIRIKLPAQSKPTYRFNSPTSSYRTVGVSPALTELADVLPSSCYGPRLED